ncbi:MAG TPA: DUF6011 domain-containing protein [Thermoleophilia bacterium]|nr:DUF6011 domain-containing protein [Thermoleophilia bacterium]
MSPLFDSLYAEKGRVSIPSVSIPSECLLRALVLQTLYGIPSERKLCEHRADIAEGLRQWQENPSCLPLLLERAAGLSSEFQDHDLNPVCVFCGRMLTHPESIAVGIGRTCWKKLGLNADSKGEKRPGLIDK